MREMGVRVIRKTTQPIQRERERERDRRSELAVSDEPGLERGRETDGTRISARAVYHNLGGVRAREHRSVGVDDRTPGCRGDGVRYPGGEDLVDGFEPPLETFLDASALAQNARGHVGGL